MAKRRFLGGVILCFALSAAIAAAPPATAVIGTPPQPGWNQLSTQQRDILAPLSKDWDELENIRKKKWLGIAERYPSMKPDEQQRMQDRMREWAKFNPKERAKIRDTYKDFKQLPPEQKLIVKQKWDAYSNLPADEKERIRASGKSSKLLAPATSTNTEGAATAAPGMTDTKPFPSAPPSSR